MGSVIISKCDQEQRTSYFSRVYTPKAKSAACNVIAVNYFVAIKEGLMALS